MINENIPVETFIVPRELQRRLSASQPAFLLDVRTPGEYAGAHIPGATLMPLDDIDIAAFRRERGGDCTPVYVLCQSGGRAKKAIEKMERMGVQGCVLVEGGTQAWIDAGLPVDRGESKVLPLMRQLQITVGFLSAVGAVLAFTINPLFALIPLVIGCGLLVAGLTGFCGLALLLAKMPWNKVSTGQTASCCATDSK